MSELQIRLLFLILSICISIFWTLTNPNKFKNLLQGLKLDKSKSGIVFIVYLVICQSVLPLEWKLPLSDQFTVIGIVTGITGVIFACWAKLTMRSSWGVFAQHDPKKQTKLVTIGPFSISRNPIYVGLLLYLLGFELALGSYFILLVIPAFWLVQRAVRIEENLLTAIFGKEYEKYKRKVPKYFIV